MTRRCQHCAEVASSEIRTAAQVLLLCRRCVDRWWAAFMQARS